MFRIALAWLLAALLVVPATALTMDPVLYVWRVTAPNATKPDYLIGTVHFSWPKGACIPAEAAKALAQSNWFVSELDTTKISTKTVTSVWLPAGERNSQRLSKQAWEILAAEAKRAGQPLEKIDHMQPWILVLMLANPADDPNRMPDTVLREAAQRQNLTLQFLEQVKEQVQLFSDGQKSDYDLQLANLDKIRAYHQGMARAYASGDLRALQAYLLPDSVLQQNPKAFDTMFFDRNERWLAQLETAMRCHDAVIAVGVGHYLGERGLLARLRAKGYAIELLSPKTH